MDTETQEVIDRFRAKLEEDATAIAARSKSDPNWQKNIEESEKRWKDEEQKRADENRKREETEAIKNIRIPKRFASAAIADFSGSTRAVAEGFIRGEHQGLFIHGTRGTGKTHLAAAILREAVRRNFREHHGTHSFPRGSFVTVPGLLVDIRTTFGRKDGDSEGDILNWASGRDYLLLDDLGAEKTTDWSMSTLYVMIDNRYAEMTPTIITSNLAIAEIAEKIGDRIASRIVGMCKVIELRGKDRRIGN